MTEYEYEDLMGTIALKIDQYSGDKARKNAGYVKGYHDGIFAAMETLHTKADPQLDTWELDDLEVNTEEKTIRVTYLCTRCGEVVRNTDSQCPHCHTEMANAELDTDLSRIIEKLAFCLTGEHYTYEY